MLIPLRHADLVSTTKSLTSSSQSFSVYLLIVVNLTIFGWQFLAQHIYDFSLIELGAVVPFDFLVSISGLKENAPRLIYALFLHDIRLEGRFLHLIGNMWYLLAFGPDLELRVGRLKFVLFYLLSGILSTVVHICFYPDSTTYLIGASGAVAGIMGAHLAVCRGTKIRIFLLVKVIPIPAAAILISWIGLQIVNAYLSPIQSSTAWGVHVSGFVVGLLMVQLSRTNQASHKTKEDKEYITNNYSSSPFSSSNTKFIEDEASAVFPLYPLAQPLRSITTKKQKRQKRNKKC